MYSCHDGVLQHMSLPKIVGFFAHVCMHNATYICPWRQSLFPVEAGNTSISDKVSDVLWLSRWGLTNIFFRQYEMNPLSWNLHIFFWGGGIKQIFIWGRGMKKNLWGAIFFFWGGGARNGRAKSFISFYFILFYSIWDLFLSVAQLSSAIHYLTAAADLLPLLSSSTKITYLTMLIFESQFPVR